MARDIDNSEDVLDSRDIIARIEELEELAEDPDWTIEDNDELTSLWSLAEEAALYAPDWEHGATLVRDSYFVDYCVDMVKDIGDLPRDLPAYLEIDWDKTADNLRVDYTSVDFDGVKYWVR